VKSGAALDALSKSSRHRSRLFLPLPEPLRYLVQKFRVLLREMLSDHRGQLPREALRGPAGVHKNNGLPALRKDVDNEGGQPVTVRGHEPLASFGELYPAATRS